MILFHGSTQVIEKPDLERGKPNNDYGRGFYCTPDKEMAKEWACKLNEKGYVNQYRLQTDGLRFLNLTDEDHTVLNWIAILLENRSFRLSSPLAERARDYLIEHFSVDTGAFDVITGYRADDSYFQYAENFVENGLSLRGLDRALRLGKLGLQTTLISQKAFGKLTFEEAVPVDEKEYYPRFLERDRRARREYRDEVAGEPFRPDDLFILDIIREEMRRDDPRLRRNLSE